MPGRTTDHGYWLRMEHLTLGDRRRLPEGCQRHWYELVREVLLGPLDKVLDVGAGDGSGLDILQRERQGPVFGTDPLPMRDDISAKPLETWPANWFEWVTAIDVIEHVVHDREFLDQMLRVARKGVFFSTPNWDFSHCENPYHYREYSPMELRTMLWSIGLPYRIWTSGQDKLPMPSPDNKVWNCRNNFGVALFLGNAPAEASRCPATAVETHP